MSLGARLAIVLLVALALAGGGFWFGLDVEQGRVARRDLQAAVGREAALLADIETARRINGAVSADLAMQRARALKDRLTFDKELRAHETASTPIFDIEACPRVAAGGVEAAEPQIALVVPDVACGADCLRLWNLGLAQGLPAAYGAWGADGPAGGADPPAAIEDPPGAAVAGFATIAELFANHGANAGLCNDLRAQLLGWQRWARDNRLTAGGADGR